MTREDGTVRSTSVYPVVMAGGAGVRFWPLSRRNRPKQFLSLLGEGSLLEMTVERMCSLAPRDQVVVVTSEKLAPEVNRLLPELPEDNVFVEPTARNTAAAIGYAALKLNEWDSEAVMAVMPSDHYIGDLPAFSRVSKTALKYAAQGHIVTLGVTPTRPETGYGYIRFSDFVASEPGDEANEVPECRARNIAAFVEKPSVDTALSYLKEGRYLWNSGMFFFRADVILEEIAKYLPDLYEGLVTMREAMKRGEDADVIAGMYKNLRSISIDFGVMENTEKIIVIPANIGWSDVGSWTVFDDVMESEGDNITNGDTILIDSSNNVAYADSGHIVAALGVNDLVVAVSSGAVLVCPKNRAQEVRRLVDEIQRKGWTKYL